jgi:hypothetical protein
MNIKMGRQQPTTFVDNRIRHFLIDAHDPNDGYPVGKLTKEMFPELLNDGPEFRKKSKLIERRLAAARINEWQKMCETGEEKPDFLPYALPQRKKNVYTDRDLIDEFIGGGGGGGGEEKKADEHYWNYFNLVDSGQHMENVIKLMRRRADGLYRIADKLERVFGLDVVDEGP